MTTETITVFTEVRAEFTIRLTASQVDSLRGLLTREIAKENKAVSSGRKLGIRRDRLSVLLAKLPNP